MSDSNNVEKEAEASEGEASEEASTETAASDEPAASSSEAPAPVKKRKKKRKKKLDATAKADAASDVESEAPALDPTGAERAAFLAWFPSDPELDVLVRAFEVGNYSFVREGAAKLVGSSEDEKVRAAARELLARIEPDPLMKYLLAAAVVLLVFLTLFAYRSHGH